MAEDLDHQRLIDRHYAPTGLADRIREALDQAGLRERVVPDDLAPLDQFHSRGKASTVELAQREGLRPGMRVLDAGGGLGGPARTLAAEFGCTVTVLDVTYAYCRVGEVLTCRTGQDQRVSFCCGSAFDMPFDDSSFDVVWMQHSTMNIEAKERLYREAHRVLRTDAILAAYEVVAGPRQPIHFPVPWAREPAASFLRTAEATRVAMKGAGFAERSYSDDTPTALASFRARMAAMPEVLPPLGLHLLLGDTFAAAFRNFVRNLDEGRVAVIQVVSRRQ